MTLNLGRFSGRSFQQERMIPSYLKAEDREANDYIPQWDAVRNSQTIGTI